MNANRVVVCLVLGLLALAAQAETIVLLDTSGTLLTFIDSANPLGAVAAFAIRSS